MDIPGIQEMDLPIVHQEVAQVEVGMPQARLLHPVQNVHDLAAQA